jgi:hypothetical protein
VANAYRTASSANKEIANQVDNALGRQSPSARQQAIDKLAKSADGKSAAAQDLASQLNDANRVPRLIQKVEEPVDKALSAVGRFASSKIDAFTDAAPKAVQGALRSGAERVKSGVGSAYSDVKASVQNRIENLPPELESAGKNVSGTLEKVAGTEAAKGAGWLRTASIQIGKTGEDLAHGTAAEGIIAKAPSALRETPILGMALAAYGTAADAKKVGLADSAAANFGSTFIGTAAGTATTNALAGLAGGTLAEGAVEGAVVASGPAGWAIAGGVVAGAAIGYGAYKAFESQAGQNIFNGIANGNGGQIVKGFKEAGTDVVHIGEHLEHGAVDAGKAIGHEAEHLGKGAVHAVSSFVSSVF